MSDRGWGAIIHAIRTTYADYIEIEVDIFVERFFFVTTRKRDEYFSDYANKKTIELFELESALKSQLPTRL
eukprot:7327530-Alexandrium_andersonii.AAC.1